MAVQKRFEEELEIKHIVKQAFHAGRLDNLYGRLSGLAKHFPPSPVILDRFISQDGELKSMVIEGVKTLYPMAREERMATIREAMDYCEPAIMSEMAAIMIVEQIFSETFKGSGYLSYEMTKHCVAVAESTRFIMKRQGGDPDHAFLFGLMFRLGVPILATFSSEAYAKCIAHLPGSAGLIEDIERGGFHGHNQFDVLYEAARTQDFPDWFTVAFSPQALSSPLLRAGILSCRIAHKAGFDMGLANVASELLPRELNSAKISFEDLDDLTHEMKGQVEFFQSFTIHE